MEKINRTQQLTTIDLNGQKYVTVNERIKFLANNLDYEIETTEEFFEDVKSWKVKAVLTIHENGKALKYSGTAIERIGTNEINLTSALENAETSAVGRACAFAGIGIEERIASIEEMEGVERQKPMVVEEKFAESKAKSKTAEEKVLDKISKKK